jgi:hypothetical protein
LGTAEALVTGQEMPHPLGKIQLLIETAATCREIYETGSRNRFKNE